MNIISEFENWCLEHFGKGHVWHWPFVIGRFPWQTCKHLLGPWLALELNPGLEDFPQFSGSIFCT